MGSKIKIVRVHRNTRRRRYAMGSGTIERTIAKHGRAATARRRRKRSRSVKGKWLIRAICRQPSNRGFRAGWWTGETFAPARKDGKRFSSQGAATKEFRTRAAPFAKKLPARDWIVVEVMPA